MQSNDTARKRVCELCGSAFLPSASNFKRRASRFCSLDCYQTARKIVDPTVRLRTQTDTNGPTPAHQPEYGNCWLWTGHCNPQGYGRVYRQNYDNVAAHRLAWELATGDVLTSDDAIGHVCDVRNCIRNDDDGTYTVDGAVFPRRGHLFKTTVPANNRDMRDKGRAARGERNARSLHPETTVRGERHHLARVTEIQVREIRERYAAASASQSELAREYRLSQVAVSAIIRRKSWRHVT